MSSRGSFCLCWSVSRTTLPRYLGAGLGNYFVIRYWNQINKLIILQVQKKIHLFNLKLLHNGNAYLCLLHGVGLGSDDSPPNNLLAFHGPANAKSPVQKEQDSCPSLLWALDVNPASGGDGPAWLPSVVTVHTGSTEKISALTGETPLLKRGFK